MTAAFLTVPSREHGVLWKERLLTSAKKNEISEEEEYKVEVTIKKENLEKTMAAVKEIHPYEEPVINIIPLYAAGI